jgi:hypothetical protein
MAAKKRAPKKKIQEFPEEVPPASSIPSEDMENYEVQNHLHYTVYVTKRPTA